MEENPHMVSLLKLHLPGQTSIIEGAEMIEDRRAQLFDSQAKVFDSESCVRKRTAALYYVCSSALSSISVSLKLSSCDYRESESGRRREASDKFTKS
jgi:hypothetical protein